MKITLKNLQNKVVGFVAFNFWTSFQFWMCLRKGCQRGLATILLTGREKYFTNAEWKIFCLSQTFNSYSYLIFIISYWFCGKNCTDFFVLFCMYWFIFTLFNETNNNYFCSCTLFSKIYCNIFYMSFMCTSEDYSRESVIKLKSSKKYQNLKVLWVLLSLIVTKYMLRWLGFVFLQKRFRNECWSNT